MLKLRKNLKSRPASISVNRIRFALQRQGKYWFRSGGNLLWPPPADPGKFSIYLPSNFNGQNGPTHWLRLSIFFSRNFTSFELWTGCNQEPEECCLRRHVLVTGCGCLRGGGGLGYHLFIRSSLGRAADYFIFDSRSTGFSLKQQSRVELTHGPGRTLRLCKYNPTRLHRQVSDTWKFSGYLTLSNLSLTK